MEICPAYISEINSNYEKQVTLDDPKRCWYYHAVKKNSLHC